MSAENKILQGKKGLVLGVANDRSIAWGIAHRAHLQGAELAFTYQGETLKKRVEPLIKDIGCDILLPCDVSDESSIDAVFSEIEEKWGKLDFLVHAVAFSDKNELKGEYLQTSRDNFLQTMDISCYSLTSLCRRAAPLMSEGSSIITLTYYGSERVMPHYNVMGVAKAALEASVRYLATDLGRRGIRINGISSGPIKTLAASGIGDFRYILRWNELNSPLHRNVTIHDVGNSALYLLSPLSSGVTGEILHVDCGYHTVGMIATDNSDELLELLHSITGKENEA